LVLIELFSLNITVEAQWREMTWLEDPPLAACVLRATTNRNVVNFFWRKSASGWPGWRIFWPWNDLARLLRWRRHCWKSTFSLP